MPYPGLLVRHQDWQHRFLVGTRQKRTTQTAQTAVHTAMSTSSSSLTRTLFGASKQAKRYVPGGWFDGIGNTGALAICEEVVMRKKKEDRFVCGGGPMKIQMLAFEKCVRMGF